MKKVLKINTQIAEHFNWGTHCDGWFLVNNPDICILQEKMPAGTMEEKHYHEKTWQFFFILSGTATMEIDDTPHQLGALDGIEIPPQVPHKIVNNTNQDLIFIVVSTPNHKLDRVNVDKQAQKSLILCPLAKDDIDEIVSSFNIIGWNKPRSIYESYLNEQSRNIRSVIVAKENDKFCGYVTIKWQSEYPSFNQKNIPEISDLNVLPHFRKNGIGTTLINASEAMAKERGCANIGLGVGMTADYGHAQRLYVHLGYVPDGYGLHYKNKLLNYGDQATIDDDLVIYLSRSI